MDFALVCRVHRTLVPLLKPESTSITKDLSKKSQTGAAWTVVVCLLTGADVDTWAPR